MRSFQLQALTFGLLFLIYNFAVRNSMRVGFLGLGVMGTPMALNLARKFQLIVWNRSASKYPPLIEAGARIAETPAKVVEQSDVVITMLFDGPAMEAVLDDDFRRALRGKTLINTNSVSVEFSRYLADQVQRSGGDFIEMPVSGSKVPAEQGQLVGMIAGDPAVAERIRPIVEPMTRAAVYCGPIGKGLMTKFAANTYSITMTVGLAEAMHLARAQGLDTRAFGQVLDEGPMASPFSKIKIAKMLNEDWSAQAAIKDCYNSARLIKEAGNTANTQLPLIQVCESLYGEAMQLGLAEEDMIAVTKFIGGSGSETK